LTISSGENLGHDLIEKITRSVSIVADSNIVEYVSTRHIKGYKGVEEGAKLDLELQHLYLADSQMPSSTGHLLERDAIRYPRLTTGLGILREGTYSPNVRAFSLLHFTPQEELESFSKYNPTANPLRISIGQALILAYSLLSADGEALAPLYYQLQTETKTHFSETEAAEYIPDVYDAVVARNRRRLLAAADKSRLENLTNTAESVRSWSKTRDPNRHVWKHVSRFRLESMVDLGWLRKQDRFSYEYEFTSAGLRWAAALDINSDDELADFLGARFLEVAASAHYPEARRLSNDQDIVQRMYEIWKELKSPQGYVPIEELALVTSVTSLEKQNEYFEVFAGKDALLEYRKENPYLVRFTVDRRGALAHIKFLGKDDDYT
jgi:hypothetical protein